MEAEAGRDFHIFSLFSHKHFPQKCRFPYSNFPFRLRKVHEESSAFFPGYEVFHLQDTVICSQLRCFRQIIPIPTDIKENVWYLLVANWQESTKSPPRCSTWAFYLALAVMQRDRQATEIFYKRWGVTCSTFSRAYLPQQEVCGRAVLSILNWWLVSGPTYVRYWALYIILFCFPSLAC